MLGFAMRYPDYASIEFVTTYDDRAERHMIRLGVVARRYRRRGGALPRSEGGQLKQEGEAAEDRAYCV